MTYYLNDLNESWRITTIYNMNKYSANVFQNKHLKTNYYINCCWKQEQNKFEISHGIRNTETNGRKIQTPFPLKK